MGSECACSSERSLIITCVTNYEGCSENSEKSRSFVHRHFQSKELSCTLKLILIFFRSIVSFNNYRILYFVYSIPLACFHVFGIIIRFSIHCRIFISDNIVFFSIQFASKHVKPNIGKIFKTNIILITKYLNLKWNIVKSFIFPQNLINY